MDNVSDKQLIQEIINRLLLAGNPIKIILFGSRALGTADERSDYDVIVVETEVKNRFREMVKLRRTLRGLIIPIDLIVISEAEYNALSKIPGTVYYHAEQEGLVLYEAA